MKNVSIHYEILMIKTKNAGHLCLVDRGSRGFAISRLYDAYCQFLLIIMNIRIYVYAFVCFVFVIYYDLQVHFHVTG